VELLRRATSAKWPHVGAFLGVWRAADRRPRQERWESSVSSSEAGGRTPWGGDAPALGPTVRRAQGLRVCHRCLPTPRLAERVVSPPKVLGPDTPEDTLPRPVRRATGWPACGLLRLYHILMGAPELKRAKPRSVAGGSGERTESLVVEDFGGEG
jgi:hypothetical protein